MIKALFSEMIAVIDEVIVADNLAKVEAAQTHLEEVSVAIENAQNTLS